MTNEHRNSRRNLKRSITRFLDQTGHYYILDNVASIMPSVSNYYDSFMFRMSATLDHPVKVQLMQQALETVAARFPYFMVELRRGAFWYYMQPLATVPTLQADSPWPCIGFNVHQRGQLMFRVRVAGARVACEFHHVLTDGTGCLTFLKSLLLQYLLLTGVECPDSGDIILPGKQPDPAEFEDSYQKNLKRGVPEALTLPKAFHMAAPSLPSYQFRNISGRLDLAPLLDAARQRKASLTELLVAALMQAWLREYAAAPPKARRRSGHNIAIEVPVNMRNHYQSRTLRNFSLNLMICLDARLGAWDFDELVGHVHHAMRLENNEHLLAPQIVRNAGSARKFIVKIIPLFFKDIGCQMLYADLGLSRMTSSFSNVGAVQLPASLQEHVERFDFVPAPMRMARVNASALSWKDKVYVNFGSRVQTRSIEQRFFSQLASLGVPVAIDPLYEEQ